MSVKTAAIARTALFTAALSASAFLRIPLGPVPLTLQPECILLAGYCLGPLEGASAALLYTALGLAGVPVFTAGGGLSYILNPTFGYIIGFTAAAFITGFLSRYNRVESAVKAYFIMIAGLTGIYVPGVLWLAIALRWIGNVPADIVSILKIGLLLPLAKDLIIVIPFAAAAIRIKKSISPRR